MAFADSEGTRIFYDDRGNGEPVLLCLPGWFVLEAASHFPTLEVPDETAGVIREFIH